MITLSSCGKSLRNAGGEVTGARLAAYNEPAPYGMVLIKRGAFEMGPADKDSLWGLMPETKGVSFDAFWMDQTEITNAKYRQFVYWVRDSIIRERLADPAYGGNDLFKITEDRYGDPVTPHLDWSRPIPWKKANEDELRAIESVYYTNPVTGEKKLDPKQMIYKYEWYDYTAAALRKNQLNPADRIRNTDIQVDPNEVVMISKDTAYIDDEGRIINETITRPLSSEWDFLNTYIGIGGRLKVSTTPLIAEIPAENMKRFDMDNDRQEGAPVNMFLLNGLESDHLGMFDVDLGLYLSYPLSPQSQIGTKLLAGRRLTANFDLQSVCRINPQIFDRTRVDEATYNQFYKEDVDYYMQQEGLSRQELLNEEFVDDDFLKIRRSS